MKIDTISVLKSDINPTRIPKIIMAEIDSRPPVKEANSIPVKTAGMIYTEIFALEIACAINSVLRFIKQKIKNLRGCFMIERLYLEI